MDKHTDAGLSRDGDTLWECSVICSEFVKFRDQCPGYLKDGISYPFSMRVSLPFV